MRNSRPNARPPRYGVKQRFSLPKRRAKSRHLILEAPAIAAGPSHPWEESA
jgi:hypothetical protein